MSVTDYFYRTKNFVQDNKPEFVAGSAIVIGWLLITLGVVLATSAHWLWFISVGGLFLGGAGFRLIGRVIMHGLYLPTIESEPTPAEEEQ